MRFVDQRVYKESICTWDTWIWSLLEDSLRRACTTTDLSENPCGQSLARVRKSQTAEWLTAAARVDLPKKFLFSFVFNLSLNIITFLDIFKVWYTFNSLKLFIYLYLPVLVLHCCERVFSSWVSRVSSSCGERATHCSDFSYLWGVAQGGL